MAKAKQLNIFPEKIRRQYALTSASKSFGGSNLVGKRKVARPLATHRPLHLVLKSSQARGALSFLNHRTILDQVLRRISRKWGVQIKNRVWVCNHIHMTIQLASRVQYRNTLVNALSQKVGRTLERFFDHRPFSRVIEWGRDLVNIKNYLLLNEMQNFGLRKWKRQGGGTMCSESARERDRMLRRN